MNECLEPPFASCLKLCLFAILLSYVVSVIKQAWADDLGGSRIFTQVSWPAGYSLPHEVAFTVLPCRMHPVKSMLMLPWKRVLCCACLASRKPHQGKNPAVVSLGHVPPACIVHSANSIHASGCPPGALYGHVCNLLFSLMPAMFVPCCARSQLKLDRAG